MGAEIYRRYPLRSVALYNGITLVHFAGGTAGAVAAYHRWPVVAWIVGPVYLLFALGQMYVLMPVTVCPSCVYRLMNAGLCTSGLNRLSERFAQLRPPADFAKRGEGVFCHNNLYLAALIAPIPVILAGLVLDFSPIALALMLLVAGLLAFRLLVIFKRIACPHCAAKGRCPNAKAMGIA